MNGGSSALAKMKFIKATTRKFLLAVACVLTMTATAPATDIPLIWDTKERLPRPDLSQLPRLRFLTTTDFPPFNFFDASGKLTGFHIDLARAICAELNIAERCQIQALPWNELEQALKNGEGEAILAGISITAQSRATYAFSRPYLLLPARFVMPRSAKAAEPIYDRVQGERIGVLAGSTHERFLRDNFGDVKPITYAKPEWMQEDVRAGKLAGIFGDGMRLSFWLGSADSAGCCAFAGGPYLAPDYLGEGLAIAVKPTDKTLVQAFDHALQQMAIEGTFAELYLRYFPIGFF